MGYILFIIAIVAGYFIIRYKQNQTNNEGFNKKDSTSEGTNPNMQRATVGADSSMDEELVAVISAAVAAAMGRSVSTIIVRSIRRLESGAPTWTLEGRRDQVGSRI